MTGSEIAIIGMAGRFPGAADVEAFRQMLANGAVAIRRSTQDELRDAGFDAATLADPRLVPAFGVLDGIDRFDAPFFGYPAARAEALDPQQRLLLECAWHALENAGYGPGSSAASVAVIGAYLSMTGSTYSIGDAEDLGDGFFALTSRDKDYAATRISYKLDLTGPSLMVQTACSGSLAAVHLAIEALLSGQCDIAIAGGCSVMTPQGAYRQAAGLMLSASGNLRAFDAAADGAVPGNGLGIVVLKPLARALADHDDIRAVILGSAMNNDGARKADYLAPSVRGQVRVIGEALSIANVDASSIGYVECHGTGTALGDPVEIRALTQAFAASAGAPPGSGATALGAVKASIGHLNVASGIAGLIRTVLALQHRTLPHSAYFRAPNPEIDFARTPFAVHAAPRPWTPIEGVRRAGVSSFGFGGTNVHVVLQEAPTPTPRAPNHAPIVLALSAKTPDALDRAMAELADAIAANPALNLEDVAFTLATGRQVFEHRRAIAVQGASDAIAALRRGGAGAEVEWPETPPAAGRRVPLPGYPFLRARYWRQTAKTPQTRPAGADLVTRLQAIFAAVLGEPAATLNPDSTYDRFGIDSLLVGTITAELRRTFPALRSTALFEHDTIRRLAAFLAPHATDEPAYQPEPPPATAIAIIGLAGRYPGGPDIDAFWDTIRAGRSAIAEIPGDRWDRAAHTDPKRANASYASWGGFIDDVDRFDPLFFGISPREAKLMDPQQRLVLQTAWSAIEDAGYTRASLKTAAGAGDVGVFAGVMNQPYRMLGHEASASGLVVQANHWSVANRVSHHFDFRGPSMAVDTGCSASLTALHLACESLRRGECGVALAGGVNVILHPVQQIELSRTGVLAHSERCAVFGAGADGFVQGEGVGIAVLKPLARALADNDVIHGVILGSAVNSGGRTSGYTVPSPAAQAAVVRAAIAAAGIAPETISYVECHGTATALGDPIEIAGLGDALKTQNAPGCAIGSVKSNIGHLESAAGIVGLTKLLLQMRHAAFVPSLGATPPNPAIDFAAGPFAVIHAAAPWPARDGIRRAGLSSFGAGGSNAHMIVEEAPARAATAATSAPVIVPVSARTPEALVQSLDRLATWLDATPDAPGLLPDLAYTLTIGREPMEHRAAFLVHDLAQLRAALRAAPTPTGDAASWVAGNDPGLAARFHGQTRRRIRLPTYPFARDRCWLPELPTATAPTQGLLGSPIPTLAAEARWCIDLPVAHPILAGHVVAGQPMLPGVAVLEFAAAAARALGRPGPLSFQNITWLAPGLPEHGRLTLEIVLREANGALAFELLSGTKTLVRGSLVAGPATPPATPDLAAARARCPTTLDSNATYARLDALGLTYAAPFRAIRALAIGPDETVADIALDDPAWTGLALSPGLLDAVLQSAAMAVFAQPGAVRLLPLSVDCIDVLGPIPTSGAVHARLVSGAGQRDFASFDAILVDAAGQPAIAFHGLSGRIDRRATTESSTPEPMPEGWFYAPIWQPQPVTPLPTTGRIVIAASGNEPFASPQGARTIRLGDPVDAACDHLAVICPSDPAEGEAATIHLFRTLKSLRQQRGFAPARISVISHVDAPPVALAWAGAARALARVAGSEWTDWTVVVATIDSWDALPQVLADPGDPQNLELAWRNGRRHVRRLAPIALEPAATPGFRDNGVYLIVGGGGGIGLELAERLASQFHARLALIGRNPATPAQQARMAQIRAAGGDVVHLVADATKPDQMRRAVAETRAKFGPIHGAIHSAIVMDDRSLELMSEDTFRNGLDVKTRGALALVEALSDAAPDWIAFFSSVNSFVANAGQANYVAGCAFKDEYALALAATGAKVRVINWGFWGQVGRVADDAYRARLTRRGVLPIETEEGIAAAIAMLGASATQIVALKASAPVLRQLGVIDPPAPTGPLTALHSRIAAHVAAQAPAMEGSAAPYDALEALSRRRLATWFREADILPPGVTLDEPGMRARAGIVDRHQRLFAAMLDALEREGTVRQTNGHYTATGATPQADIAAFRRANPELAPHADLLQACADSYTEVLTGRLLATQVMFPESSLAFVEGIYRGNRLSDFCNALVAEVVAAAVDAVKNPRVLEIGAGTGGTTRSVIPRIAATPGLEYVFTDISLAFTKAGRRLFGPMIPNLVCRALDIGRDPATQDIELANIDVVLGANVVHATPDLVKSLTHACALLKPGGLLILYELTALYDFGTLTFGTLDGWWMSVDERLPNTPLLDVGAWRDRLGKAGFADVIAFSEPALTNEQDFRQSVIIARKPEAAAPTHASTMRDRLRRRTTQTEAAPANALIQAIQEVVAETLEMRLEDVKTDRSFADFGADSILGVTLVEALARRLAVPLSPTVLFSHQTVTKLAQHLTTKHGESFLPPLPPGEGGVRALPTTSPAPTPTETATPDEIAVIGWSGRFPGAPTIAAFWDNMRAGIDSVGEVPPSRWDHDAIYDPTPGALDRTNCWHGGFLDEIEYFDPLFFGLSPNEAAAMDPQQRLFLEEAWHALEDAGYASSTLDGTATGVFVGTVAGDYDQRMKDAGRRPDAHSFMGTAPSMLAARIAYRLDLRGPCLSIDTACSSSLVAIHLACESLRRGESAMALAGGVAVMTTPAFYLAGSSAGMLSPAGRCRTLDAEADGFVPAEAVAVLVLKRLADALRDNDHIHGVIRATGVNQDGASNGITAPNGAAQTALIRQLHHTNAIDPASIGYVELHGTGTRLGDPIELDGLAEAFGPTPNPPWCAIGSAKANIGHGMAAAGAVGLIRALLILEHRTIPPAVNFAALNPHIDLAGTPFHIPKTPTPWPPGPTRAAVSAFGFSGTNAHAILEPAPSPTPIARAPRAEHLAVLSAETEPALRTRCDDLAAWLQTHPHADIADVCFTLGLGRNPMRHRIAFTASDIPGLIGALATGNAATTPEAARFLNGETIDWPAIYPPGTARRIALPVYPFARRRCWPDKPSVFSAVLDELAGGDA